MREGPFYFLGLITLLSKVKDKGMHNELRSFVRARGELHNFIIYKLSSSCSATTGQGKLGDSDGVQSDFCFSLK